MISAVVGFKDGKVSIHSSETKYVDRIFNAGFYSANIDNNGNMHIIERELAEIHVPFVTKDNSIIINTVAAFFNDGVREKVESLGFTHKIGALLHGKQGCGKTSLLNYIADEFMKSNKAIVFLCENQGTLTTAIQLAFSIREIQSNPIIFIADEFEKYCRSSESELKNFLDGNMSISNSLFLAATNYIEDIPDTLKDRPSRFKIVVEIVGITEKSLMKAVIKNISDKINPGLFNEQEIDEEISKLSSVTMDELKHICLNKVTNTYIPKELSERPSIGFRNHKDNINEKGNTVSGGGIWTLFSPKETHINSSETNI